MEARTSRFIDLRQASGTRRTGLTIQWGALAIFPCPGTTTAAERLTSRCIGHRPANGLSRARRRCMGTPVRPGTRRLHGNGTVDIAVYRPSTGFWFVGLVSSYSGAPPAIFPCPGTTTATERSTSRCIGHRRQWFVTGQATVTWGRPATSLYRGDYDGNGTVDIAVYRPSTGIWFVQGGSSAPWGAVGDIPASRAYVPR